MWMTRCLFLVTVVGILARQSSGQQYDEYDQGYSQDYTQDSLYHDYAMKQQEKDATKGPFPWGKVMIGTAAGWLLGGKIHAQRKEKKLNAKHKEEQKALYTQYYNDVYTLQQQNAELAQALEKMGVRVQ
ncbi:hypothetical protein IV203_018907 [Nitzschia inconspicua]|uniref:Uncharacterized protein n=1 Tax=Nitzschia inconspicua TaxID=303405 RepID=A0A9K3Q926_9STRA|nr:hypothetical protein IV203_018907 [Nitzschia inconspicua]